MKAVILAGGIGTRLWPLSRANRPKQFTPLLSDAPLIRDTYRRLLRLFAVEDIFVSTSPTFADAVVAAIPEIDVEHLILEPCKRDTGPAMLFAASRLFSLAPDEPMVFVPSDHYIRDEEKFLDCIRAAGMLVERTSKMVDIGVVASFPSPVLGYLKLGERLDMVDGIEVYAFAGQKEKPDYETAKRYLEDGGYLWNASYFTWTPRKFLEAADRYAPDLALGVREETFESLPSISFDYAIAEKMSHEDVLVLKGDFGWSDIGAWDTLYARLAEDRSSSNVSHGALLSIDAEGNLVHVTGDKLVALLGVSDLVVVDTDDALLVTTKEHAQRVKELIAELSAQGHNNLL